MTGIGKIFALQSGKSRDCAAGNNQGSIVTHAR